MGFDGSLKFDTAIDGKGFDKGLAAITKAAVIGITAVATIVASAGTAVIHYGSQMEASMAQVSTIVSGTAAECNTALNSIQTDLINTSNATGIVATDMASAAYEALSASVAVSDVGEFVDLSAKLAVGGFTTVSSSVDVLSSVVNAYGKEVITAEQTAKILMQTQNKGKTTIDQLSASMANVTPTAAAMNVEFEQIGASLATMTAQGIPTAQATTQLNQLFAELGKNGTVASDGLAEALKGSEYAGKSFSVLMDEGVPISELLMIISQHAKNSGVEMLDMFGSIEAGKAALALVNNEGKLYLENLSDMSVSADVVTDAYTKMMDTFPAKKQVFVTSIQNMATAAYKYIEEPLKQAADVGIKAVQQLSSYIDKNGVKIINTGKGILKALVSITAALITVRAAFLIANTIKSFTAAMSLAKIAIDAATVAQGKEVTATLLATAGLKTKTVVMGAFTGQVGLATAATTIFKTALTALGGPIGLTIAALGLLVGALVAFSLAQEKETTQAQLLIEESKLHSEKLNELKESYEDVRQAALDKANDEIAQIDNTQRLWRELQTLADENGNVAESDRIRATFITNELSTALGTEIELTGGQIQNYKDLQSEISKTIQLKRAETLLKVAEESYTEAIKNRAAAEKAAANLYIEYQELKISYAKDSTAAKALQEEIDLATASITNERLRGQAIAEVYAQYEKSTGDTVYKLHERVTEEQKALDIIEEEYTNSQNLLKTYYTNIESYETNHGLLLAGNIDEVVSNLERQNQGFLNASETTKMAVEEQKQVIAQQYAEAIISLANYAEQYALGTAGYTEAGLKELERNAKLTKQEADKVGVAMVAGQVEGINSRKIDLTNAINATSKAGIDAASLYTSKYYTEGQNAGQGYVNGITSKIALAGAAAGALAGAAIGGVQNRQRSNSPAKALIEKGHDGADGYIIGFNDRLRDAALAGESLAAAAINGTNVDTSNLDARLKYAALSGAAEFGSTLTNTVINNTAIAGATYYYDYSKKAELKTEVVTRENMSESELTREQMDALERGGWKLP